MTEYKESNEAVTMEDKKMKVMIDVYGWDYPCDGCGKRLSRYDYPLYDYGLYCDHECRSKIILK